MEHEIHTLKVKNIKSFIKISLDYSRTRLLLRFREDLFRFRALPKSKHIPPYCERSEQMRNLN
jgi:hypothetical protein